MEKTIPRQGNIVATILIAVAGMSSMVLIGYFLMKGTIASWEVSQNKVLNFTFTMQMMALSVSFIAVALMFLTNKEASKKFFRLGIPSTEESGWNIYGPVTAVAFTIGTTMFMSFGVIAEHGRINETFFSLLPLVLLFAATNAWSEEILFRFVIVAGLDGKLQPHTICLVSAILFGVSHAFFGTPSGLFGVVASGSLGWFLAKSFVDTKGMGWALFIHFLQDVVIFGAGAMIMAGR